MQGVTDADAIWSARQAAEACADFAELHAAHGGVLWVRFDPRQARCGLFFWRNGRCRELTPPGFSVRSRVYEYGGGACCATERGVAFVNERDQQLYQLDITTTGQPCALTASANSRYGGLSFVPAWQALLAVEEAREVGAVIHRIVRIGLDGRREVLVEGADFYAAPVASEDGRRLAWIEWDRPDQPWIATRLCLRESGGRSCVVAGQYRDQALQQPRFDASGRLWALTDRAGWWQPWCVEEGATGLYGRHRDHAPAPWQLGGCTYLPLGDGELLLTRFEQGVGILAMDARQGPRQLAEGFTRFRALAADAVCSYCIAAAPDRLPAVLAIGRRDGAVRIIAGGERPLSDEHLSWPQAFSCVVAEDERCHGFFHAPAGRDGCPPLVIFLHGGPTSACYPVFDPRIAFWTLRGYAVLDLNYRGSSGYGRAYRLCLAGQWGELEVEDVRAAIAALGADGRADASRVFVRGASAGGFSTLRALSEIEGLRGGASLYGVADPLALRRLTHKFEGDYLDWLIGDPCDEPERYHSRTPLLHPERIGAPLIIFQGALDAVVVPSQSERMVQAMRERGLAVQYRLFADEGHGFRHAQNLAEALQAEWRFYQALL